MPSISYAGKKIAEGVPAVVVFGMLFLTVYGCGHMSEKTERIRARQEGRAEVERLRYKRDSLRVANGKEPLPSGVVTISRWGKATPPGVDRLDTDSLRSSDLLWSHKADTIWQNLRARKHQTAADSL